MFRYSFHRYVPLNGSSSFNAEFGHNVVTPATVATSILGAVSRCAAAFTRAPQRVRQGEDKQLLVLACSQIEGHRRRTCLWEPVTGFVVAAMHYFGLRKG